MSAQACILIVEDSPTQTRLLRLILEEHGYIVDSATTGLKPWSTFVAIHPI
jgi:DNA-binding response OmpR family regulator